MNYMFHFICFNIWHVYVYCRKQAKYRHVLSNEIVILVNQIWNQIGSSAFFFFDDFFGDDFPSLFYGPTSRYKTYRLGPWYLWRYFCAVHVRKIKVKILWCRLTLFIWIPEIWNSNASVIHSLSDQHNRYLAAFLAHQKSNEKRKKTLSNLLYTNSIIHRIWLRV